MNSNPPELDQVLADADGISHLVRTRFGIEFDARNHWWPIDGKTGINVTSLRSLVTPQLLLGLEMTLRDAAGRYAWATLSQFSTVLKHFQRTMFPEGQIERWHLSDLRNWRVVLMKEFGHEDYLRQTRSLLLNWLKGGWPGVTKALIDGLKEMRLKGAETGRAVRVSDPEKGPLTPEESHHLLQCLYDAAESGRLSLDEFSLAYLHFLTGRRPIQSADMKCQDVVKRRSDPNHEHPEGKILHLLLIPRAKQKGHGFRQTRRAMDLNASIFEVFRAQRDNVQERFRTLLEAHNWELQVQDLQLLLLELPLYPNWTSIEKCLNAAAEMRASDKHGRALEAIRCDAVGAAWHRNKKILGNLVAFTCSSVGAVARDGSSLQVNPLRLRHTKGTSLAREGLPVHVIAWLLDHSTSRRAGIYIDNLPEHAAQINAAMSKSPVMQRLASVFRGTLVDSEADAVGGNNPGCSRVHYKGKGAATCGYLKQCGLDGGIPRACYTCRHFQPWLDGPHEELLEELLQERSTDVNDLGPDSPISKRRDTLIVAVTNVVHLCQTRRQELDGGTSTERAT